MPRGALVICTRDVECDIWITSGDVIKCVESFICERDPVQVECERGTSITSVRWSPIIHVGWEK
jgi:hypothetical protein